MKQTLLEALKSVHRNSMEYFKTEKLEVEIAWLVFKVRDSDGKAIYRNTSFFSPTQKTK